MSEGTICVFVPAVKCPLPPTIDNGSYRIFTSGEPATIPVLGDVIEYSCVDENFVLEGENALTCMSTGLYDRKPPTCKEVRKVTVATPTPTQKPNYRLPPGDAGGIIALGVFGGFVFLAAVITTIVILVRRRKNNERLACSMGNHPVKMGFGTDPDAADSLTNQNARMRHGQRSHDSDTISSMDSSGSESRGLNRYYKRAWENLRDAPPGAQQSHQTKSSKHLPSVYRPDTLDSPNFRGGSVNEGMRDGSEMVISDAFAKPGQGGAADKKRHHHHHHHHHSHKRRQQPGYPPAGRGSGY
ncbi:unnamed protein product [Notodromas monacha]|uniref:Sushi domain-containing protein n=1 Tax=Notodromas monacha TaxID=399045 RepID=A0A7R9GAB0_9CRUS|nr:unnamed protein product [Notodromas monacha]CAG0913507.1 unnamed protein product [Notodromas monacha]